MLSVSDRNSHGSIRSPSSVLLRPGFRAIPPTVSPSQSSICRCASSSPCRGRRRPDRLSCRQLPYPKMIHPRLSPGGSKPVVVPPQARPRWSQIRCRLGPTSARSGRVGGRDEPELGVMANGGAGRAFRRPPRAAAELHLRTLTERRQNGADRSDRQDRMLRARLASADGLSTPGALDLLSAVTTTSLDRRGPRCDPMTSITLDDCRSEPLTRSRGVGDYDFGRGRPSPGRATPWVLASACPARIPWDR